MSETTGDQSSSGQQWYPIETAPKDGTEILAATRWGVRIMYWEPQQYHKNPRPYFAQHGAFRTSWDRENQPTHWMPLPAPPEMAEQK